MSSKKRSRNVTVGQSMAEERRKGKKNRYPILVRLGVLHKKVAAQLAERPPQLRGEHSSDEEPRGAHDWVVLLSAEGASERRGR